LLEATFFLLIILITPVKSLLLTIAYVCCGVWQATGLSSKPRK